MIGIADWARRCGFVFDPGADVRRFGLLPTMAVYDLASGDRPHLARVRATSLAAQTGNRQAADPLGLGTGAKLPDIVLVQAESFFDARRLGLAQPGIDDALVNYARLQRSAFAHGTLDVLSSGGNSLRSEFAVLSGMSATESGVHALNPYHRLAREKVWSLAWHLRALGYRTIAVHPYSGDFFWRNQVYAHLGFERFIDIDALGHLPRCGPFVGDIALGSEVERLRAEMGDDRPTFIFVITMEAHGPWHPTRVSEVALAEAGLSPSQLGSMQLAHYLYHTRNTDRMLGALAAQTTMQTRPGVFCLYGDHLPPIAGLRSRLGFAADVTDYLIVTDPAQSVPLPSRALSAPQLGQVLCRAAGLPSFREATPRH
ncbi:MAG: LTA synthase family protein [Alphaproteobacteria bacterium]